MSSIIKKDLPRLVTTFFLKKNNVLAKVMSKRMRGLGLKPLLCFRCKCCSGKRLGSLVIDVAYFVFSVQFDKLICE